MGHIALFSRISLIVYLSMYEGIAGELVWSAETTVATSNPTRIKVSSSFALGSTSFLCQCKKDLLSRRKIDRPFVELPIRDPQFMNKKLVEPSAKDEETLIRVGLLVATVVSADHTSSPAIPSYMDKYTISEIRLNNAICRAY